MLFRINKNDIVTERDVKIAYRLLLGRDPEAQAVSVFKAELQRREMPRLELIRSIVSSKEFKRKTGLDDSTMVCDMGGYVVCVRTDDADIGAVIASKTPYEPYVTAAFKEYVAPGWDVLDVGANVGFFTMMAANLVGPTGKVIAVEPMDKNLQLIYSAVTKNKFNNVEVFPFAASSEPTILAVHTNSKTSNAEVHTIGPKNDNLLFVSGRPLDPMLEHLDRLDLIKIDIEGFEPVAFAGLQKTLGRLKPVIITEFHPQALRKGAEVEPEHYAQMLFALAPKVTVLGRDSTRIECSDPDQIMAAWKRANDIAGFDGSLHLDLLVVPPSRKPVAEVVVN